MYQDIRISVAIATYNGEKYIREQLESILSQTVVPDEIIISDDGSKDKTLEIAHEVAKSAAPGIIKILTDNPKHGFAYNFGHAISHCTGDVILLCDQDDVWLPYKVEHVTRVYTENKEALCVFHDASSIDSSGKPLDIVFNPFIKTLSSQTNTGEIMRLPGVPFCETAASAPLINGMVMSVSRILLQTALPLPPVSSQHDGWLWFCAEALDRCYFLNEVLTLRRLHDENTSGAGKQGFGLKRIRKIMNSISRHNDAARTRIVCAKYMQDYLASYCHDKNPGAMCALPTLNRIWEIGQAELIAAKSSRLSGGIKLIRLFIHDKRYRKSGKKAFLYELADIMMRSKEARKKNLEEMGL